jgi:hypothetical protein
VVVKLGRRAARPRGASRPRPATAAQLEALLVLPPGSDDPAADRGRFIGQLVQRAAGDRGPLEELRSAVAGAISRQLLDGESWSPSGAVRASVDA